MNQQQLKYARERAERIKRRREEVLKTTYCNPPSKMSVDDKISAIRGGAFVCQGDDPIWHRRIVFLDEPRSDWPRYNEESAKLTREYDALLDQLILGDSVEALRLLKAFEEPEPSPKIENVTFR